MDEGDETELAEEQNDEEPLQQVESVCGSFTKSPKVRQGLDFVCVKFFVLEAMELSHLFSVGVFLHSLAIPSFAFGFH